MRKIIVFGVAVIATSLALSSTGFGAHNHVRFDCDNTCGVQCGYHIFVEKALYKTMNQKKAGERLSTCMMACVEKCPEQQGSCGQTLGN